MISKMPAIFLAENSGLGLAGGALLLADLWVRLNVFPARTVAPMSEPGRNLRRAERALLARLEPHYVSR